MTTAATGRRQLTLPEELCAAAEEQFASRFDNVESLLEFVLREITRNDAESLDHGEQAILEQRLRDLGYI